MSVTQSTVEPSLYLREKEVAQLAGLSKSKINEMGLAGLIPGRVKFDRAVRYHRPMVLAWLNDLARGGDGNCAA